MDKKWILSIDTCCGYLSFALLCPSTGEHYIKQQPQRRGAAEVFFTVFQELFQEAGITVEDLSRIGVTRGPGSFTSVRIGLAAVKGFETGLGVETFSWNTLEMIALSYGKPCTVLMAAHGDNIFVQSFGAGGVPEGDPISQKKRDVMETVSGTVIGDAPLKWDDIPETISWDMDEKFFQVDPLLLAEKTAELTVEDARFHNLDALYVHPLDYKKISEGA